MRKRRISKRRARRKYINQDEAFLLVLAALTIIALGVMTVVRYNAWICEAVPNHYTCEKGN